MTGDETPGALDVLNGINGPRDVQARDLTILDLLVNTSDKVIATFSTRMPDLSSVLNIEKVEALYDDVYSFCLQQLEKAVFDEKELEHFIFGRANHDLDVKQSQVLGIYSGCLAQILTERNALQGKRTTIHVNGLGNRFSHLFYFARCVDTIVVENFVGEEICSYIGSFGGYADAVVGVDLKGNRNVADNTSVADGSLFNSFAQYGGKINMILGIGINGVCLNKIANHKGFVSQAIAISIRGDETFASSASLGCIEQVVGVDLYGEEILKGICNTQNSVINQIICVDTNCHWGILEGADYDNGGKVNQVVLDNVVNCFGASRCFYTPDTEERNELGLGNADEFSLENASRSRKPVLPICKEIIYAEKTRETYPKHQAERIEKTVALARSMKDKPYLFVLSIAQQLYLLRPAMKLGGWQS